MVCIYLQSFGSVIWFQKYWLIKTKVLTHLKKKLSCIIRQYFINLWYTSKENEQPKTKGKLRTYSTFKNNYGKNTITTLSRLEEKYITKLRISTHQWSIEKGRQCRVPRVLNNIQEVEDEQQFLLMCSKYNNWINGNDPRYQPNCKFLLFDTCWKTDIDFE